MRFISSSSVATALLFSSLGVEATPDTSFRSKRGINATTWKPTPFASSSTLSKSSNYVELKKVTSGSAKHSAAYCKGLPKGSTGLTSLEEGQEFAVPITIGTQNFEVILDTGSSDTWVVEKGFECVDVSTKKQEAESYCGFGTPYTLEKTFKTVKNEQFSIGYGDGEFLQGPVGTETVTLAGIAVKGQIIALGNYTGWFGDGTTSGLTGFAYPALTSAYTNGTQKVYNPLFTTMYERGLVDSYFSLAILRDVSGPAGYLTLGGLPPIDFDETFTSTPILITSIQGYPKAYDFYTVEVDSINLNGKALSGGSGAMYIVDSGTTLNYYPTSMANEINAAFSPPATYSADEGAYVVSCNATAPKHSITIGGTEFIINPLDMILNVGNNTCISGIIDGGSNASEDLYILGDVFQKNVVSVFDVGAVEMRFAPHVNYTSNDTN
ncbi:aspartic-type endopeptidase, putative [Talaromyces stipitatus ATCC 10500]|uniref:Aspartic-type endopeptidase, putative n=1 Tax=Talaromyces stipitatus (strain ATCC 10500 / CBS 375.48 / QM 6759 / NRRL 1006) TaxID=441959 RepID=B8MKW9_TALSN|nr:aspartic-type endopeptidase, putative [Talaromyces stipitatus ATCC 10500]EED14968.1 aspartic-type endopeptidase, putative [Talaromyces stipitatus ATCC 10500]